MLDWSNFTIYDTKAVVVVRMQMIVICIITISLNKSSLNFMCSIFYLRQSDTIWLAQFQTIHKRGRKIFWKPLQSDASFRFLFYYWFWTHISNASMMKATKKKIEYNYMRLPEGYKHKTIKEQISIIRIPNMQN